MNTNQYKIEFHANLVYLRAVLLNVKKYKGLFKYTFFHNSITNHIKQQIPPKTIN